MILGTGNDSNPQNPNVLGPLRTGPCDRYDENDLFFNPYGYVRLTHSE